MSVLAKLISIGFLASPFLIGYGMYLLLNPIGFWQMAVWFALCLLVCVPEGIISWTIAVALWEVI